jgi:type I restriction enzyme S subunit
LPPIEEQQRIAALLDKTHELVAMRRRTMDVVGSLPEALFRTMFVEARNSWDMASIESLAAQRRDAIRTGPFGSQLLHDEFTDSGIAVLGIDNAVENRFAWGRRRFISEAKYTQLRRYTVRPGDVLVTIMGTCGRVAVVPHDIPRAINTKHLCCISLDEDRCLPEFLWGCLRFHPQVLRQLGATRGAVMPGLNMGLIKRAEVPVPPIQLQPKFVEEMASIRHQQDLMQSSAMQLDALLKAVQHRLFEGAA